jgi:NAD(P)-dependent dehydrogenase (short-subunit alcohol dehydrogenase family)
MKDIQEQVILVTGSTDGIGKQTALDLARMGATILLHGRDRVRAETTLDEIVTETGNERLEYYLADFSSLAEVRRLAETIQAKHSYLDVLINNAGIGAGKPTKKQRELSRDGYELRFAVNYLALFLLTNLLVPSLHQVATSRIVNVVSLQQAIDFNNLMLERNYDPVRAYGQSKLAATMFIFELAELIELVKDKGITVNCLHPGSRLDTKMVREWFGKPLGTINQGAEAIVYLATSPRLDGKTGKYFYQKQEQKAIAQAYDRQARQKLWQLSKEICNL